MNHSCVFVQPPLLSLSFVSLKQFISKKIKDVYHTRSLLALFRNCFVILDIVYY